MIKNNWKEIWRKRTGDLNVLENTLGGGVLLELKKINGFYVVGEE